MQAVAKSQKIKKSTSTKVFYVICYTFVALMALVCCLRGIYFYHPRRNCSRTSAYDNDRLRDQP